MSNSNILSIRELIDTAFGESDENIVNFKLIQTILLILAKQLRLLQRRVEVNIDPNTIIQTSSNISITEVKLNAIVPNRKKKNIENAKQITKKLVAAEGAKTSDPSSSKSTDPSLSTKTGTQSSSEKTKSSTDKTSVKSRRRGSDKFDSEAYHQLLEVIEQQRERELRIVNQRANSREEAEKSPTPMASLDSIELQHEKLFIVERTPSKENSEHPRKKLSIVTQEEFDKLAIIVKELQEKFFQPVGKPEFPDNVQLMHVLRRGASLTDAMAALQLSARLESAEKALEKMMSLTTEVAKQRGIDVNTQPSIDSHETKIIFDGPNDEQHESKRKQSSKKEKKSRSSKDGGAGNIYYETAEDTSEIVENEDSQIQPDCITIIELNEAMQQLHDSLLKTVSNIAGKATANTEDALNLVDKLEGKLNSIPNLAKRMNDLETLVSGYAEQITILDTGLSLQMTSYQEQLTQMQHDLEAGLEAMGEALANTGGDTAAVAELNTNFTNLQVDFDATNIRQKELRENQDLLSTDIQSLWRQIEYLVGTKSDREEVADALRDKAGLGALNGLVTHEQFDAVRGDFEKRIGAAYDKFNNQELIWQKAIDELIRELNEKADWVQVISLRDDVKAHLENLKKRIDDMIKIVGEPRAAAVTKRLFQDAACISCSSPAYMALEEACVPTLPAFTKPKSISEETKETKPKEYGDNENCYPGKPIPHLLNPKAHFCQRYCGGSHTKISKTLKKCPTEIIITTLGQRQTVKEIGADGQIYRNDELQEEIMPCHPCNKIPTKEVFQSHQNETGCGNKFGSCSNATLDYFPHLISKTEQADDTGSMVPPPTVDYEN